MPAASLGMLSCRKFIFGICFLVTDVTSGAIVMRHGSSDVM